MKINTKPLKTKTMNNTELRNILKERFPTKFVTELKGSGGKKLSSVKAYAVVQRLNDAFGIGNWRTEAEIVEQSIEEVVIWGRMIVIIDGKEYFLPYTAGNMTNSKQKPPREGYTSSLGDLCKGASVSLIGKSASFIEAAIDVYLGLQNHNTPDLPKPKIYPIPSDKWESVKPQIQSLSAVIATVSNGTKEYKAKLTDKQVKDYLDLRGLRESGLEYQDLK